MGGVATERGRGQMVSYQWGGAWSEREGAWSKWAWPKGGGVFSEEGGVVRRGRGQNVHCRAHG